MNELNKIIHADCMDIMRDISDNYFELAIVDPPYGIGANKEKPHNGWKDYGIKDWDSEIPTSNYFKELFRVSQNQIVWGGNYFTDNLNHSMGWVVWDKGQREFSLADGEMAWSSFNKAMRIYTYSRALALKDNKIHPTQKPVALYKWLLHNYAKQGDKILDTHSGSGTTAMACIDMGFDYLCIEKDKDYYEASIKRIDKENIKLKLAI